MFSSFILGNWGRVKVNKVNLHLQWHISKIFAESWLDLRKTNFRLGIHIRMLHQVSPLTAAGHSSHCSISSCIKFEGYEPATCLHPVFKIGRFTLGLGNLAKYKNKITNYTHHSKYGFHNWKVFQIYKLLTNFSRL